MNVSPYHVAWFYLGAITPTIQPVSRRCATPRSSIPAGRKGTCFNGVIDPLTGKLLPDIAAALGRGR